MPMYDEQAQPSGPVYLNAESGDNFGGVCLHLILCKRLQMSMQTFANVWMCLCKRLQIPVYTYANVCKRMFCGMLMYNPPCKRLQMYVYARFVLHMSKNTGILHPPCAFCPCMRTQLVGKKHIFAIGLVGFGHIHGVCWACLRTSGGIIGGNWQQN